MRSRPPTLRTKTLMWYRLSITIKISQEMKISSIITTKLSCPATLKWRQWSEQAPRSKTSNAIKTRRLPELFKRITKLSKSYDRSWKQTKWMICAPKLTCLNRKGWSGSTRRDWIHALSVVVRLPIGLNPAFAITTSATNALKELSDLISGALFAGWTSVRSIWSKTPITNRST